VADPDGRRSSGRAMGQANIRKPPFDPSKPYRALTTEEFDRFDPVEFSVFKRRDEIKTEIEVAFVPPLLLLMLGAALTWVIRGFRA
jgi:hypothetical protein